MEASAKNDILAATHWCKGDPGKEVVMRLVLVDTGTEYVTFYEHANNQRYEGDYYQGTIDNALRRFLNRVANHNMLFKSGNVSHFPGLAFVRIENM